MLDPYGGDLGFALSAAFDAAVLCGAVALALRREPAGVRLLIALLAAAVVLAVKGVWLVGSGLTSFGVMHVVWLDLVVALPLAGLVALVVLRRRAGVAVRIAAVGACCVAPLGVYASLVEPGRLKLERAEIELPPERAGERPLRIGLIADLQFEELGAHEREAVERLMAERPDVVLLAGDYHQGRPGELDAQLPALRALLRRLHAPGGVFAVQGDVESVDEARRVTAGTGVRLLVNELARVRVGDRRVALTGLERAYWSRAARDAVARLERSARPGEVRIVLAHRPDAVRLTGSVDLTVAGHTHGGQLQLPFVGPLATASAVPGDVAAGGLHELEGRPLYVSRGVEVERGQAPRLRFGAVPEVSLITLR